MMSLIKNILNTLRWSLSVGAKFIRVVPGYTLWVVLATLVSQIAMLLAFLLPLKIIMLLGSPGIPRYFPRWFLEVDRGQLVIWLSLAAFSSYVVHLSAEKLISYWSDRGAQLLLQKSQKITLFDNQVELATSSYRRYTRCLAGGVFTGLVFVVLAIIYTSLAALMVGYCVGVCVLFILLHFLIPPFRARTQEGLGDLLGIIGALGFLLAFAFMVMDFLFGSPPSLLVAIITIILVRQALSRMVSLIKDITALSKQRLKINALFFHGHALLNDRSWFDYEFWSLLKPNYRGEWLKTLLAGVQGAELREAKDVWYQTGVLDVAALDVRTVGWKGEPESHFYVKLFNTKRKGQALHEATLLMAFQNEDLPSLHFLGIDQVEGYNCHIFDMIEGDKPLPKEVKIGARFVIKALWTVEPPKDIVSRFCRSRPLLPQRIGEEMGERLLIVANDTDAVADVKRFAQSLDIIREKLSALPLSIYNPDLGADSLIKTKNNEFLATHWGRWVLEPVGAGWPLDEKEWDIPPEYLARAAEKRPALAEVGIEDVRLAALMFAFERQYNRQRYISAIELLPDILGCLEPAQKGAAVND